MSRSARPQTPTPILRLAVMIFAEAGWGYSGEAGLDRVVQRPDQYPDSRCQILQVDGDVLSRRVEPPVVEVAELAGLPGCQADFGAWCGGDVPAGVRGGVGFVHPVGEQQPG